MVRRAFLPQGPCLTHPAFFAGNDRFYIRGVDYQPGGASNVADPIADANGCKRDLVEFQKLGINTVRVYSVDNSADHDECMSALADAGIYLVLDVNTPLYSLNRGDPNPSYNEHYLQSVFATIDMFAKYDNTLAFFSGNEVVNDPETSKVAPYVKAVTRDIRQYIRNRGLREIPVGYSAADVSENRLEMAEYMNCGTDDARSDFFAFNDYSWCDPSSFQISGWDQKVKNFTGYGLPIFLSEYGCNTNKRDFGEVKALYSTEMTGVYSGGLVYEYSMEPNKYGLVEISGDSVSELDDFTALMDAFKGTANPQGDGGYNSTGGASGCPAYNPPNWDVQDDSLPAIPQGAMKFMTDGAGSGPGLSGPGSQNAGGESTGTATAGSGQPTRSGSTGSSSGTSSSAASGYIAPTELSIVHFAAGAVVVLSSLFGAALL
jgi:1,3-beta-glucanosyltransferase GAS5